MSGDVGIITNDEDKAKQYCYSSLNWPDSHVGLGHLHKNWLCFLAPQTLLPGSYHKIS
jgi:hypothetical protein